MFGELPDRIAYRMPSGDDLPANTVEWKLDPARLVLLIHDMQRYFLRPLAADREPYGELIANTMLLRDACRAARIPVGFTAQPGGMTRTERGLLHDIWGGGMTKDDSDRPIVDELAPEDGDLIFTKWRYSAFHSSDLGNVMRSLGRDQLIVTGVYGHVGVLATAIDAYSRDIETFLASDAIADFTPEDHGMTLRYAAARCARVEPTRDLVAGLSAGLWECGSGVSRGER